MDTVAREAAVAREDLALARDRLKTADEAGKVVMEKQEEVDRWMVEVVAAGRQWEDRARGAEGRVAGLVAELEWWRSRAVAMARGIGLGDAVVAADAAAALEARREVEETVEAEHSAVDPEEVDLEVPAAAQEVDLEVPAAAQVVVAAGVPVVEEF